MTERLCEEIKAYIDPRRLRHVYGTEEECRSLSRIFLLSEEDTDRLSIAALLHDITKRWSREEHLAYMETIGQSIDEDTLRADKTLHALTGAYFAREKYPALVDDAIFNAIRYHTTGRKGMSLLEKLLYLADYIEPSRTFPSCVSLRHCFYDCIDKTEDKEGCLDDILLLSLDLTVQELLSEKRPIHPDTLAAQCELLSQKAAKNERKR